ncbi:GGDEF domain-containing protein [Dokdonella sp.]|uniref:GGDEF domain-containing protein n=1 Tax=Dokdonella sp. TaxID=2291710 RepID=UPI002F40A7E1
MMLDVRTTIMVAAVLAFIIGASLRFVMRDYPPRMLPSMRLWALGTLSLPTAWMLYGLRGQIADFLSIVVANSLLGLAFALQVEGIRVFVGRPHSRALVVVPVAAIATLECVFTYAFPSMRLRGVLVSAIIGAQLALAVWALVVEHRMLRRSRMLTAATFAGMSCTLLLRATLEVVSGFDLPGPFAPSFMQSMSFALGAAFPIAGTLGFLLMCNDRLNRSLARKEEHLRAITDNLPIVVAHVGTDRRFTFANAYLARLLGVESRSLVGRRMADVLGPLNEGLQSRVAAVLRGETSTFQTQCDVRGERRHLEASYIPDFDADRRVRGFFILIVDITRLHLAKLRLARMAESDALTGLANRKKFGDSLAIALARAGRSQALVGVLYVDVDRFKPINDTYGHAVGDAILREFARRLRGCVRETDLAARIGGDEFAVLVEDAPSVEALEAVAQKLLDALDGDFVVGGLALKVRASIGIGFARGRAKAKALLRMADRGLYEAKTTGSHGYRLGPSPATAGAHARPVSRSLCG